MHTKDISDVQCINICALNVYGLHSKLTAGLFEKYILSYDIICLSETKLTINDKCDINGYKHLYHPSGGIHGISVLVTDTICDDVSQIENTVSQCVLWLLFKNIDIIIGAVYIPPSSSDYYNDELFDDIMDDMSYLASQYKQPFVMLGDFNARTANLDDDIDDIDFDLFNIDELYFDDCAMYNLPSGILHKRSNKDTVTNANGLKLIEFCQITNLNIINGRVGGDSTKGDYTCHKYNGKSVIDYAIASKILFQRVIDFYVDIYDTLLSDSHPPICLKLRYESNLCMEMPNISITRNTHTHIQVTIKSKWKRDCESIYTESFDADTMHHLHTKLLSFPEN